MNLILIAFNCLIGTVWMIGGAVAAKRAIVKYEAWVMEQWGPGGVKLSPLDKPQYKMDGTDWSHAIIRAAGTFLAFPVIVLAILAGYPLRWAYKPMRSYFLPPVQKAHESHVADINIHAKALAQSVGTYNDMLNGEPPVRPGQLHELEQVIQSQWEDLMSIMHPDNAFDQDFKEELKARVGWDDYKELTA